MTLSSPINGTNSFWPASTGQVRVRDMTDEHLGNVRDFMEARLREAIEKVRVYDRWLDVVKDEQLTRAKYASMASCPYCAQLRA